MNKLKNFRPHQSEADDAIYDELLINNKCIVKMFCGTGKSLLMRKCKSVQNQKLVVYVFPSLSLIDQFCNEYFIKVGFASPFKISSENESTTDPVKIKTELKKKKNKIICVTYQSYKTLLDNLGLNKIDVCIYDESHHAVGETYQKLIFEQESEASVVKQIFFTATPKNANGIIMYDRNNLEGGMCGKLVYDYSYLQGLNDEYVNPFEIRVDMYTENTNKSVYESIARAALVSGNNRVLTFHADVNTDRDTSVRNFVNEHEFIRAFYKVIKEEFPEKAGLYTRFKMIALDASIPMKERRTILDTFDTTLDNEVYIISSCETIGEGIDTKNANMCVFVDPKSSFVKIIQNIGRIVRPQSKPSTVLIPCWVDKDKYVGCDEDKEKCDEVIRSDLNKDGNFNGILNVLSALRQEDEDIYDICLHYPDTYSPQEIRSNLEKHGYKVLDQVGDGELVETMEYLLDEDIDYEDYEDCEANEEMIMRIAEDNDVCVEVHTKSFENQIEKYNSECESGNTIRLYKEETDENKKENQVYCPIVKKCGKRRGEGSIKELNRKDRIKIDVHTNPDVKVLWKLVGDFTKDMCSCVLECEVVEYDPMEVAVAIVEWYKINGFPKEIKKNKRITLEQKLETQYHEKLTKWKSGVNGSKFNKAPNANIIQLLDKEIPNWSLQRDLDEFAYQTAIKIVERAKEREKSGFKLLPRHIEKKKRNTSDLIQENTDSQKLDDWKHACNGGKDCRCSENVKKYLDDNLTGWRISLDEQSLLDVKAIVKRANERVKCGGRLIPKSYSIKNRTTSEKLQENKDATKLTNLTQAINGGKNSKCPDFVRDYLNINMPGWCDGWDDMAYKTAIEIVDRAKTRLSNGGNLLPVRIIKNENKKFPELEQENKDAQKLYDWKAVSQNKKTNSTCSEKVKEYLDIHLPGWRIETNLEENALNYAHGIVERSKKREENGKNVLPRAIPKKNRINEELEQETMDYNKLGMWRGAIKGKGSCIKYESVINYLNIHLQGWHFDLDDRSMEDCISLVTRAETRQKNGGQLLPRNITNKQNRKTPELEQEYKDAIKLNHFKSALKDSKNGRCPDEVRDYLDTKLPGWRDSYDLKQNAIEFAYDIIERAKKRLANGGSLMPYEIRMASKRNTEELEQIHKDASKISNWKQALKGNSKQVCYPEVRDYLDKHLNGWRNELDFDEQALQHAKAIVFRKTQRPNLIPRRIRNKEDQKTPELEQENKDYIKLRYWKIALKEKNHQRCSDEVRDYLDETLKGWRTTDDTSLEEKEEEIIINSKPKTTKSNIILVIEEETTKPKSNPKKSYEEMTENERRDFIEKHLQKHKEKNGYNSTNPDDKDRLNNVFSKNISIQAEGKIIFLDHIEFKTAYALLEYGIKPEDMIIPQRSENYYEMHQHEIFGQSVVLEEFNDTLNRLENENIKIKAVYADYCSTLEKDGIPFLELMSKIKDKQLLCKNAILGVTITLRNPEGVRFQGQDITIMEKKILRIFPNNENLLLKSNLTTDDEAYTYGNGAPMATWVFNINN